MFFAKEKKVPLENEWVDCITFGNGQKTLVMIQGLNTRGIHGAALPMAMMYRAFLKDYTVYLFERRRNLFEGITVRDFAGDVARIMDHLNLQKADVFGVSQGGMIAQYLAIDRPDLVGKLVLGVTSCKTNDTVTAVIENWISLARQGKMREMICDMAEKMYSPKYLKYYRPLLPLLTLVQKPRDVERFILLARSCLTCDTCGEMDKIRCPVFVIGGKQDQVLGKDACEEVAKRLNCPSFFYENLGHAAYEEAKDFNQKVLEFLRKGDHEKNGKGPDQAI